MKILKRKKKLYNMSLSILIPLYNEEKNIKKLYLKIKNTISSKIHYELIFINDDSTDGSTQILNKLTKNKKKIIHINRKKKKRDLTQSCFDGILRSKYKNILIMDCDLQHNPKNIIKMFKIYNKKTADFVIGVRNFDKAHSGLSYHRSIVSRLLIIIINIFLGKKISDPMSGFFLFKKKHFFKTKKFLYGEGYKILFDLIYNLRYKVKIIEYEITLHKRSSGESKMSFKILKIIIIQILRLLFFKLYNLIRIQS